MPIRRRKLMPPDLKDSLVARPRLLERLDRSLEVPLTLVVAPAGYGKSTLVRQWTDAIPTSAAWLTLDAGDADGRRLVAHLVSAVAAIAPIDGNHVLGLLRTPSAAPMADIGATLADDLFDCTEDLVLVLDDCQTAATGDVLTFLSHFLPLIPPAVHVVLISRADLPLALARPRAQGLVNDLRAADLRFSTDEIEALVARFAPRAASPDLAGVLQAQTEGWITGLRLAVQALARAGEPAHRTMSSDDQRHLMQFLVEEVLANEAPEVENFLLRISIVDQVCAPLADALAEEPRPGRSQEMLDYLVQANLFLEPAGDDPRWVRFHPLFRQLLRHLLTMRSPPGVIRDLHVRAGRWYAGEARVEEAVTHFLAAGEPIATAQLIEEHLHRALATEDWQSVASWLRLLPDDLIHARPGLLLARAWMAHLSGRASPLRSLLAEAESLLQPVADDPETIEAMRAEIGTLSLSTLLPIEQDAQAALRIVEHARAHLPARSRFARGLADGYVGLILQTLGQEREARRYLEAFAAVESEQIDAGSIRAMLGLTFVHRQAGNLQECANVARQMLVLAERAGLAVSSGWAHLFLGWIAYEADELETAKTHFAAIASDYRGVHLSCLREAMFGMALVFQVEKRPAAAAAALERLNEIIIDTTALEHLPSVQGFAARLAIMRGDTEAIAHWLAMADVSVDSTVLYAFEHPLLTRARALLAVKSPDSLAEASADLEALRERAERTHHRARLVEIWAVIALVRDAQGDREAALDAMHRSLALAAREPIYRTYLDLGPAIIPLLRQVAMRRELPARLRTLLDEPTPTVTDARPEPAPSPSILLLLTPREGDVLERLGRRLSYQEIAEELFISPGTVKRHVGSIYSKLNAGNRREALARAETLGWKPSA